MDLMLTLIIIPIFVRVVSTLIAEWFSHRNDSEDD